MKRTKSQNQRLYGLFQSKGIDSDMKADLILQFTNGRTTKSSEMLYNECQDLIESLTHGTMPSELSRSRRIDNTAHQAMRRGIFRLMYDCGFISNDMEKERKDFIINDWIRKKMDLGKTLNELTTEELQRMTRQLQTVRRNYMERAAKAALNN